MLVVVDDTLVATGLSVVLVAVVVDDTLVATGLSVVLVAADETSGGGITWVENQREIVQYQKITSIQVVELLRTRYLL